MTIDEFIQKWLGKKIDFDGAYGGQCVDLYRQYVQDVLGYPQSPGVGGAAEIWDSADPAYYDFIELGTPKKGDIVIWNRKVGGGFGHVDVFVEGNDKTFTGFDQNWPTLDKCTLTVHNYNSVIGWLHPKGGNVPGKIEIESEVFEELVRKSTLYDEFKKAGYETIANVKQLLQEMRDSIDSKEAARKQAEDRSMEYEKLFRDLVKTLADESHLNTTQDADKVIAEAAKVSEALKDLEDLQRNFAALKTQSEEDKSKLNAEIAVLKEKLNQDLSQYETRELLRALINRLLSITKK